MTHAEKLKAMRAHMDALGIPASTTAPPLWNLLWRMGVEVPPPMFMGFGRIALLMGSFFGVFWGLLMWLMTWSRQGMPAWIMFSAAALAGTLFGLAMAVYFRYLARKHKLPSWDDYAPTHAADGRQVP